MISVTKLLCGMDNFGDRLRYGTLGRNQPNGAAAGYGPVVAWNVTRTCNLKCVHCYSDSAYQNNEGELTTAEAMQFIEDLVEFRVPVLLFSGGEPFLRPDLLKLAAHAKKLGIRPTISTNGTLINPETAESLKDIEVGYVGVSIDGINENNDRFRGHKGAFKSALNGIRNCIAAGVRVGLRFTINKYNYKEIDAIFDLVENENIPRVCFYHLVYAGRGSRMMEDDITIQEVRMAMDVIIKRTLELHRRGIEKEVLTVDNHADGVYIYLKLKENDPERASKVLELLKLNGGNRSGMAFGAVDWYGNVHPDQFTQNHIIGNVKERKFGEIWTDKTNPILSGLKNRRALLKGRCAACCWLDVCNGNFRARAEAVTGDFWETDPACYLTDEEIRFC